MTDADRVLKIGPWRYVWTNINPVTGETHRIVEWWSASSDTPVTEQTYALLARIEALEQHVASAEGVIAIANELFSAVTFYWDKATPRNRDLASRLLREYDKEESRHREAHPDREGDNEST